MTSQYYMLPSLRRPRKQCTGWTQPQYIDLLAWVSSLALTMAAPVWRRFLLRSEILPHTSTRVKGMNCFIFVPVFKGQQVSCSGTSVQTLGWQSSPVCCGMVSQAEQFRTEVHNQKQKPGKKNCSTRRPQCSRVHPGQGTGYSGGGAVHDTEPRGTGQVEECGDKSQGRPD